jgi:DNA-directed RNA polymerase subunit RPC12/RpoP
VSQINPIDCSIQVKYICTNCGKEVLDPDSVTYSNSTDSTYTSATSAEKYCYNCNTRMIQNGDWWECPNCHYGHMDYARGLPKDFTQLSDEEVEMSKHIFEGKTHIPCDNVWGVGRIAVGQLDDLMSNTLQFDRCERIIFRDKTLDFVFEIPEEQYKDIDTIIVNGIKFVRENSETDNT